MTILLDTNVLIAAFISRGLCDELLEHCTHRYELVTCEFILKEYREKLVSKFSIPRRQASNAVTLLREQMVLSQPANLPQDACRDPDDIIVLGAAVGSQCQCLITGDKDLLVLKKFAGIDILSPGDFWKYEIRFG